MKILLETKRLYLREFDSNDRFNLFHLNNNPKVVQFTGDAAFESVEDAAVFIENYSDYEKNGFGRWAVCLKSSNEFIGWCGLKLDRILNEVDLGFRFFEKHWSKGYATESAKACIVFGFHELNITKIVGRAYIENKASIKVLEKCNFTFSNDFLYDFQPAVLYTIEK